MSSSIQTIPHKTYVQRLYKRALRTAFDYYAWNRDVYRQHCLKIRSRFEANKLEQNPIRIQALVREAEEELEREKHPRPVKFPTAYGGVKYKRNAPPPIWLVNDGEGNWQDDPVEFEKI